MTRQNLGLAALVIAGFSLSFTAAAAMQRHVGSIAVVISQAGTVASECEVFIEADGSTRLVCRPIEQ